MLVYLVYHVLEVLSKRRARKSINMVQASIQTVEIEPLKLVTNSIGVQTDRIKKKHAWTSTDVVMSHSVETQTLYSECPLDVESKYSLFPETPTKSDTSEDSKFNLLPDTPSTCNGDSFFVVPETAAARTSSVVSSSSASEMDLLLQSAMMSMSAPREAEDENSLFTNVEWGGCSIDRFTTSDTFISG